VSTSLTAEMRSSYHYLLTSWHLHSRGIKP